MLAKNCFADAEALSKEAPSSITSRILNIQRYSWVTDMNVMYEDRSACTAFSIDTSIITLQSVTRKI